MKNLFALFSLVLPLLAQQPLRMVIAGDSTVAEYAASSQQRGWGEYIQAYFSDRLHVYNLAKNGRSTKTFLSEGLWAKGLALKPDFILIQFGHNDSHDPKNPEATNAATDYPAYLRRFVSEARTAGAMPILITPVQRRTKVDSLIPYAEAMRRVATEEHVALIDLHADSGQLYKDLGPAGSTALAASSTDQTHFNEKGARAMAALVMKRLPDLDPRLKQALN